MSEILTGFTPIIDENSKMLILGSMPSVASLNEGQYYAHPQNRFWKIMFELFGAQFTMNYERRQTLLLENGVALWDSIGSCERVGSLDSAIKNAVPNDIGGLLKKYPNVKMVFTNGKKSNEIFERYNKDIAHVCLPSTSPANAAFKYEKLFSVWKEQLSRFS